MSNSLHSRYWLGNLDADGLDLASIGTDVNEAVRLAGVKRAISNFVRIVTGRAIPVRFNSGNDSYTSGDFVVISANTKEKTFDAVVGLALHEATHCVWREFPDFLAKQYMENSNIMIPQDLKDKAAAAGISFESSGTTPSRLAIILKILMNVFEDRRIDWYQYREAPGYRPYYDAMYNIYFHSKQIDYAMQQGRFNKPTIDNYINQLINMTNRWFDTKALTDLDLLYGLIDVNHINRFDGDEGWKYVNRQIKLNRREFDLDKMPGIFQLAVKVAGIIFDQCPPEVKIQQPDDAPQSPTLGEPADHMEDNLDVGQGSGAPPDDDEESDSNGQPSPGSDSSESDESGDEESDDDADSTGADSADSAEEGDESDGGSGSGDDDADDADSDADGEGDKDDDAKDGDSDRKDKEAAEMPNRTGKLNEKKLQKALDKQKEFLDGDVQKKKLSRAMDHQVNAIEQSGASQVDVSFEGKYGDATSTKVLVLRKLDRQILVSGAFPFTPGYNTEYNYAVGRFENRNVKGNDIPLHTDPWSVMAITNGFRMGNILASKLSIRNQNQVTKFNRRSHGKVDKRRLAFLGAGEDSVFYKLRISEYSPVLAHMSIDASSSMHGQKWQQALTVGIAVAVASSKIENLDFVLSMRAGVGAATIAIIYDSRIDKPAKMKQLFPYLTTKGNTPEGLCFAAIMDDILAERHGERYFINLSDGMPMFGGYGGETAYRHTRDQVNRIRGEGLNVLSYYISDDGYGESREGFSVMYGKDAAYIDVASISSLAGTLNRLFLER